MHLLFRFIVFWNMKVILSLKDVPVKGGGRTDIDSVNLIRQKGSVCVGRIL